MGCPAYGLPSAGWDGGVDWLMLDPPMMCECRPHPGAADVAALVYDNGPAH
ncbi:hypothetical protein GCM10023083_05720 [Streptomyces phyllanthi]